MNMNSFCYSIELIYYSISFCAKQCLTDLAYRSFLTNSSIVHMYEHMCSSKDGSKTQLYDSVSTLLMP